MTRLKQETPGVTGKFGLGVQNEAGQRLIEVCQENALVIANTLFRQHKRRLYTMTSPDGQYQDQIDYILFSQRWRSSIQSAKTRLEADFGSDHEFCIAKFRLKLKKVGKTTGFHGGSDGKASACNSGDPGSIPGLGRSPGEGNGNPLQYSCLKSSMNRGAWWATFHGVTKSRIQLSDFTLTHTHTRENH